MASLSWLEILLFLCIGAFLFPAMAGGAALRIAGIVIAGIAVCGLITIGILQTIFGVRYTAQIPTVRGSIEYHQTSGLATGRTHQASGKKSSAKHDVETAGSSAPADTSLDAVQFERERAEIERQWHDAELERRLWHTGSLAGGLFAWLAIATAYLKFDLLSAGRHRNLLRLATVGGLTIATAAAACAWTPPM